MSKKIVLMIFVVGLLLGYIIPRNTAAPVANNSSEQDSQNKLDEVKGKLQQISEQDIAEYIKLKDMKAKYEKADEIFGKILNIFLLDLGLRMSGKQLEDLKASSLAAPENPKPVSADNSKVAAVEPTPAKTQTTSGKPYINSRNYENDEQVLKFLGEKNLENPIAAWSSAKPVGRNAFNLIDGHFLGNIFFIDASRATLDLEMELSNARFQKGQIVGEFVLKTTDPTNPKYRDTTRYEPNSKIPNFRLADDGAILVEAMGGDGIFQLYYNSRSNAFQGNLYEKKGLDQFKRTGNISLNRR